MVLRLAGKNDKAIRQLELTYGGGKTHTLITLYHLTNNPRSLPADLPAVQEFTQHIGQMPPQARVAVLAFDKLDAEKGMQVRGPDGEVRRLKHPWSVLAFQLAGREGLRILNANDEELERESPRPGFARPGSVGPDQCRAAAAADALYPPVVPGDRRGDVSYPGTPSRPTEMSIYRKLGVYPSPKPGRRPGPRADAPRRVTGVGTVPAQADITRHG